MYDNEKTRKRENGKTGKRENDSLLRFTFYVLRFAFIGIICLPSAFGQGNTGKIEGQVINKQKNLSLVGQSVSLQIHKEGKDIQQRETVTDDSGSYAFDNLSTAFDVHYVISTTYEDEEYAEKNLVLSEWLPEIKVNIEIGAFTDDPSQVKIRQHTLVISPPPADHAPDGAVSVMEIIRVENTSDVAFQTSLNGQLTGLHFNLPKEYESLQIDQIFKQEELVAETNRLVSNQPLEPGTLSLGFSYVTHVGSGLDLSRKLAFDTDQLYVFVAEGMPLTPQSRILGAGRQERIHDEMVYTIYATDPAKPLSAGETADLRFKVASVAPPSQSSTKETVGQPSDPKMIALIAIAAALAGGFLVAAIFKIRTPTPTQPDDSQTPQAAPDASWLRKLDAADIERTRIARLEMVTRLEALYEKREISERVYKRLRKEQADRLAAVLEQIRQ